MQHILYRITNLLTGQYYIGKHSQEADDDYLGSSPQLKRDIAIQGRRTFIRETISTFDNEEDCYLAEANAIGDLYKSDADCYNKQPGGKGFSSGPGHYSYGVGFTEDHLVNLSKARKARSSATVVTRAKMSETRTGSTHSPATRKKISIAQTGELNHMFNKHHTDITKALISAASKELTGTRNSQFTGWYVTPWGKASSLKELSKVVVSMSGRLAGAWCKSNKTVTKSMISTSKFLSSTDLGKTFKELGFYFEGKQ